jgi:hypothetical protein
VGWNSNIGQESLRTVHDMVGESHIVGVLEFSDEDKLILDVVCQNSSISSSASEVGTDSHNLYVILSVF